MRDLREIAQDVANLIVAAEPMVVGYEINPVFGTVRFIFPKEGKAVWFMAVDETRLHREDRDGRLPDLAEFLLRQWQKRNRQEAV